MARVGAVPFFAVVVVASLAACLEAPPKDVVDGIQQPLPDVRPQVPVDLVDPLLLNHDHADAKLHKYAYDVTLLNQHPLGGNLAKSSGAHVVDVQANHLFVGAYGATVDTEGGLYIFDLKTPAKPALVGQVRIPGNLGGDRSMEASDDGNWVALGTEPFDCAGHLNPFAPGLFLIDARDKSAPKIVDYVPGSVHSLTIHRIKGDDYVMGAITSGDQQNIYKIDKAATPPNLVPVGRVSVGHDSAAYDDPVLGKPLLYATGGGSLNIFDLSNPSSPPKIGNWTIPADERAGHYVHAIAVDWVEGRRVVAFESEDWALKTSPVWILDATDLTDIDKLATWTNPGAKAAGAEEGELTFSTHNPRMENGILYLAHYHGGVWFVNVSTLALARAPETMGYYIPHNDNGGFVPRSGEGAYPKPNICGFDLNDVPNVFDVEVKDGIVYAADLHTGVYTLRYDDSVGQLKP